MEKYLEAAIDDPTPENVSAYHYLQRYAMDASERFARIYQRVALSDPNLDGMTTRPTWNAAGFAMDDAAAKGTAEVLKSLSSQYGLWFFFRSDCEACHIEAPAIETFARKHGFTVYPISIDGPNLPDSPFRSFRVDNGHAQQLGVQYTPAIYLVRPPKTFISVSQGLVSASELEERIIELASQAGVVSDEQYQKTRGDRKNLLPSPAQVALPAGAPADDPQFIRQQLMNMLRR